ncbi:MAG: tail fiber domain-containing protein, partial [Pseudobdellovibrio sp.]
TGNILASTYLWTSDARLKNIESKSEGLAALDNINGYKFNWKSDGKSDYGVIAQEVEQQFPELVITQPDGVKTVNYLGLIAPLIESIHELKAEQIKLKKEIEYLKKSQKKHK